MNHFEKFLPNLKRIDGSFSPLTYSVGIREPPQVTLAKQPIYPVDKKEYYHYIELLKPFYTLVHELSHVNMYLSSLWGYRVMRSCQILAWYLTQKQIPLRMPLVGMDWLSMMSNSNSTNYKTIDRFMHRLLRFVEDINEIRPFEIEYESPIYIDSPQIYLEKYISAPIAYLYPELFNYPEVIVKMNHIPRKQSYLVFQIGNKKIVFYINAGLILESLGRLSEIYHRYWLNPEIASKDLVAHFIEDLSIYTALPIFMLSENVCNVNSLLTVFFLFADISLNYELSILQDDISTLSYIDKTKNYPYEQLPGETFLKLIEASKTIDPIRDSADIERYANQLIQRAGMPNYCSFIRGARNIMKRNPNLHAKEPSYLHHYRYFLLRKSKVLSYSINSIRSEEVSKTILLGRKFIQYYDLDSKMPINFFPDSLVRLVLPQVLTQIVFDKSIECPLKMGVPFKCHAHNKKYDTLCAFKMENSDAIYECPADDLAKLFGLERYLAN